jgi:hypothetical protein
MDSDKNAEDAANKETQEFDPVLVDEEGIHPESAEDTELVVLEQEQTDNESEEKPGHGGSWHQFKTP